MGKNKRKFLLLIIIVLLLLCITLCLYYNSTKNNFDIEGKLDNVSRSALSYSEAIIAKPVSNYDYNNTPQPQVYTTEKYTTNERLGYETCCVLKFIDDGSIDITVSDKNIDNRWISVYQNKLKMNTTANYVSDSDDVKLTFLNDSQFQIYFESYPSTNRTELFQFNKIN